MNMTSGVLTMLIVLFFLHQSFYAMGFYTRDEVKRMVKLVLSVGAIALVILASVLLCVNYL